MPKPHFRLSFDNGPEVGWMLASMIQNLCELADATNDEQIADDLVMLADAIGVVKDRIDSERKTVILVHNDTPNSHGHRH